MSSTAFVYTMNKVGAVGAWSRYVFPFPIQDFTQLDDHLYIRSGNDVLRLDDGVITDFAGDPRELGFDGLIQWPWLDMGMPGITKQMVGFDLVGNGVASIEFGFDQSQKGYFTDPYEVPEDTVPGMIIPMPLMAPSFSVRLTYEGGQAWKFDALNVYLNDSRMTA
jgi:hypothetical protein